MTEIYIIRHTQAEGNLYHMMQGHWDGRVTELGWKQIDALAERFRDIHVDAVYSSDLKRAFDTALPNAKRRGLPVVADPALREIHCGRWEGQSKEFLEANDTEAYAVGFRHHYFGFTMPDGESEADCRARILGALTRIARQNEGKTVLIVSHGAAIRSFFAAISGLENEEANKRIDYPSNASYSVARFDGERFIAIEYSHDSHLTNVTHVHI